MLLIGNFVAKCFLTVTYYEVSAMINRILDFIYKTKHCLFPLYFFFSQMEETNLKVFSELRKKHPDLLFFISRKSDFRVILYNVNRDNMSLSNEVCNYIVTDLDNPERETSTLSSVLIDNFYGFSEPVDIGNNTYELTLNALPDRQLKLKLKKDRALLLGNINGQDNAVVLTVFMDISWSYVVPKLENIVITALNPKTKQLISEKILVTPDMLKRYDVSKIIAAYIQGK